LRINNHFPWHHPVQCPYYNVSRQHFLNQGVAIPFCILGSYAFFCTEYWQGGGYFTFSVLIMDIMLRWSFLLTAATSPAQPISFRIFSRNNSSFCCLVATTTLAPLIRTEYAMSTDVVYCCWFLVQSNVSCYSVAYRLLVMHFTPSEDVGFFQPYIPSKEIYLTAFRPRNFFDCLWSHYIIFPPSPCTQWTVCIAALTIANTINFYG